MSQRGLFIANGTHQRIDFTYRVPEFPSARVQPIAVGGQIKISGSETFNPKQIEAVIHQYEKYGMIPVNEILDSNGPAPLAWQVDKPITTDIIELLVRRNQGELVSMGEETRKNAAIVLASHLGRSLEENNVGGALGQVEVDVEEETGKSGKSAAEHVGEGVVVTTEGRQPRPTLRGGAGRR